MAVSAKIDYACQAVLGLATRFESGLPVPLRDLASAHGIPPQFLTQIFQQLKAAGIVESIRGASGGYRLAKPPSTISVWDVMSAVAAQAPVSRPTGDPLTNTVQKIWQKLEQSRRDYLQSTSFADLLRNAGESLEPMYYI